jgi:hypothetical protein
MVTTEPGRTVVTVLIDAAQFLVSGSEDGSMPFEL